MADHPPEPPALAPDDLRRLIAWLDGTAAWLRDELGRAEAAGRTEHGQAAANLELYEDASLLLREAYDGVV